MVRRGCGRRIAGGIYLVAGTSPFGSPPEHFLVDYPLDAATIVAAGLSPIGQKVIGGVLYDWIGAKHYPTPADFYEEFKLHGASRRVSPSLVKQLTPGMDYYLVHPLALCTNHAEYARLGHAPECPKGDLAHTEGPCACLWYLQGRAAGAAWDAVEVSLADGVNAYTAWEVPEGRPLPKFVPGIFLKYPTPKIEVIRHPDEHYTADQVAHARKSGLEVDVVDE